MKFEMGGAGRRPARFARRFFFILTWKESASPQDSWLSQGAGAAPRRTALRLVGGIFPSDRSRVHLPFPRRLDPLLRQGGRHVEVREPHLLAALHVADLDG